MKRIIALLTLAGILLCGCGRSEQGEAQTDPKPEPVSAMEETQAPPTEEATEPPGTETPTEATEPSETEPPSLRHSGIREDGTFDEGTLFIGDFLTYGLVKGFLKEQGLLGDARYMILPNAALTAFYYGPVLSNEADGLYSPEFGGMLMCDAITVAGEDTTAIYFMMGTNVSKYATDETYIQIVDDLLEACPNATIFLQLVPYDRSTRVNHEEANRRVQAAYEHFQQEGNERVLLIDTQTAIGYNLTTEGIQLTAEGQACWYQALVAFAEGNKIPQ